jgi:hypothetical protein
LTELSPRQMLSFPATPRKMPSAVLLFPSEVTYRIDVANKKPLAVPIEVRTYANPR